MGHHNLVYNKDTHALHGAWSPPTSKANFCEEDYAITYYIAEFINSVTNLTYVYFAFRYMYAGNRSILSPRIDHMSASLLILGICSFLYHASMRQTLQFADDLSMVVLCWALLQATLTMRQSPERARRITIALAISVCSFSAFYVWSGQIIIHYVAFSVMLVMIGLRGYYVLDWSQPKFPDAKRSEWKKRAWTAVGICVVGYILWNIDLEYCMELRSLRERIGLPWAWLLEFHGWWHILTAIGADKFIEVVRELQEELEHEKKE